MASPAPVYAPGVSTFYGVDLDELRYNYELSDRAGVQSGRPERKTKSAKWKSRSVERQTRVEDQVCRAEDQVYIAEDQSGRPGQICRAADQSGMAGLQSGRTEQKTSATERQIRAAGLQKGRPGLQKGGPGLQSRMTRAEELVCRAADQSRRPSLQSRRLGLQSGRLEQSSRSAEQKTKSEQKTRSAEWKTRSRVQKPKADLQSSIPERQDRAVDQHYSAEDQSGRAAQQNRSAERQIRAAGLQKGRPGLQKGGPGLQKGGPGLQSRMTRIQRSTVDSTKHWWSRQTEWYSNVITDTLSGRNYATEEGNKVESFCLLRYARNLLPVVIGRKKGLRSAAFWPTSALMLAAIMSITKLISIGALDAHGTRIPEHETFRLGPRMPFIDAAHLIWNLIGDERSRETVFNYFLSNIRVLDILPIGPLPTGLRPSRAVGYFWSEDAACLSWLDEHPPGSVVYVAFLSLAVLGCSQLQELTLGLEATGRPFLCVVRPNLVVDSADACPNDFKDHVRNRGMMVAWAPPQEVLAHPSVGCFVSHCGWNSTMEGVRNGKLFLCWPYFADQFLNQSYICDHWKVGLSLTPDESGIFKREQLKSKVEVLLGDAEMSARASSFKEKAQRNTDQGGASFHNLKRFIHTIKAANP
ncbi:hypothetical protein ZIOFF_075022 [Zingiber officinale]|uniref:Uncharacterized protein n=1 Tax=Zingiber officinale TaxID=94328 RepID=A0A8J5B9I0_ZINOF|nr:hypothetical protein ZIOFF_075022 [Zingiber officinale]